MDSAHSRVSRIYSSVNWGLEMSQAFVTLGKQEVATYLKNTGPTLRMCGHDRHWARAADSTKLAGPPSSSSRISSDACQQPSGLHLQPSHWPLTQNQHTPQNLPLLPSPSLVSSCSGRKPGVTFNFPLTQLSR